MPDRAESDQKGESERKCDHRQQRGGDDKARHRLGIRAVFLGQHVGGDGHRGGDLKDQHSQRDRGQAEEKARAEGDAKACLLYTSPSPRD